jgi:hypothetical protein
MRSLAILTALAALLAGCQARSKLLERDCVEKGEGAACEELAARTRPVDRSRAEAWSTRAHELFQRACARGDAAACARIGQ